MYWVAWVPGSLKPDPWHHGVNSRPQTRTSKVECTNGLKRNRNRGHVKSAMRASTSSYVAISTLYREYGMVRKVLLGSIWSGAMIDPQTRKHAATLYARSKGVNIKSLPATICSNKGGCAVCKADNDVQFLEDDLQISRKVGGGGRKARSKSNGVKEKVKENYFGSCWASLFDR
ncbi:hypothetical protein J3R30DRAFT_3411935 [Lentinula aciculospora]|uniref:Uncharacterized protein n=1 Tax=Lentinula aciculospora TaxID=153920 RepID=A0A9W9DEU2_9AGAR|nr:hypothetical protein J3R30DRAFT_3411935 [Lentinula aciculospora]